MWYLYMMEFYSATKKKDTLFLTWSFLSFCVFLIYHSVLSLGSICFHIRNYIFPISIIIF
jgi:hypothetical protein